MLIYDLPLWALFGLTMILVAGSIEAGFRVGTHMRRKSVDEKESSVSSITGTVLALLAFILAFTFAIVANRYDARKELVREQAITISTAYDRTDFLPEPDRTTAKGLFDQYIAILVEIPNQAKVEDVGPMIAQLTALQHELWEMGVKWVDSGELNTPIGSLYMDSLNQVGDVQALRVAVALQARIPTGLWVVLATLVALGMVAVGYQTAIAESRRSLAMLLLALSFSIVIVLIAALDNPASGYLPVSQRPLLDMQSQTLANPSP